MDPLPTYVDLSDRRVLRLAGADVLDLIQRTSTNDVAKLQAGGVVHTILTTEKGKILDVVSLVRTNVSEFLMFSTLTQRGELKSWIERFIIMEDISVRDATEEFFHYELIRGKSPEILPAEGRAQTVEIGQDRASGQRAMIMTDPVAGFKALHFVGERGLRQSAESFLQARGYVSGAARALEEFYVISGFPVPGRELSREVNPHEAGLRSLLSFTKGCYIGQEIIARLDTYKKIQKLLMPFHLDAEPAALPAQLTSGAEVLGELTSAIRSHDGNSWVGLAFVKSAFVESPLVLTYAARTGVGSATVRTP